MPASAGAAEAAFKQWVPPPPASQGAVSRESFRGLSIEDQADKALSVRRARGAIGEATTYDNQKSHLVRLLRLMKQRGRDIVTIDPAFMNEFRQFLQLCVDGDVEGVEWSSSYVGGWINTWNPIADEVFQETDLKMKYMGIEAKDFSPISPEEYALLDRGVDLIEFEGPDGGAHNREAFRALFELDKCTGARVESSLLQPTFTFRDIRWRSKTVVLRKMKRVRRGKKQEPPRSHEPVVTNRALNLLHEFGLRAAHRPYWHGIGTQVFLDHNGRPLKGTFFSRALERICKVVGIERNDGTINPHLFRKTLGNYLWGRFGEKVACAQLGISEKVLRKHYTKGDPKYVHGLSAVLPGGELATRPDEERLAALRLLRGELDPITYDMERELRDVRQAIEDLERQQSHANKH